MFRAASIIIAVLTAVAASAAERVACDGPISFRFAPLYAIADGRIPGAPAIVCEMRAAGRQGGASDAIWHATAWEPTALLVVATVRTGLPAQRASAGSGAGYSLDRWLPAQPERIEGLWPADLAVLPVLRSEPMSLTGRERLCVDPAFAAAEPDRVVAMRAAWLAAWDWCAANPAAAVGVTRAQGASGPWLLPEADALLAGFGHEAAVIGSPAGAGAATTAASPAAATPAASPSVLPLVLAAIALTIGAGFALRWGLRQHREQRKRTETFTRMREVHGKLMPSAPRLPGLAIAMRERPHGEIGGDLWCTAQFADGRYALVIGDVAGKDMPAALVAMAAVRELRHLVRQRSTPGEVMAALDASLRGHLPPGCFLTAASLVWDPARRHAEILRAGHLPVLLARNGSVEEVGESGPAIGLQTRAWAGPAPTTIALQPGDRLLMLTDGVTEAESGEGEFGLDGVRAAFTASSGTRAAEAVMAAAEAFAGELGDDATVIAIEVLP